MNRTTPAVPAQRRARNAVFADLIGARVTVMGLGLHGGGLGAAKFLATLGARVTVTDLKSEADLAPSVRALRGYGVHFALGGHHLVDFRTADVIVYNPDVRRKFLQLEDSPYLAAAMRAGARLETDIGLFLRAVSREQVIGITGSKGKSTVAALSAHLLRAAHPKTLLAGNIRTSVLEVLPQVRVGVPIVLELSSWQLEGIAPHAWSPHIAVVTNVLHEHLNTYRSFAAYARAKYALIAHQKPGDTAVLGTQLAEVPAFKRLPVGVEVNRFGPATLPASTALPPCLVGLHGRANAAAAACVAAAWGVKPGDQKERLRSFKGLEGRFQTVSVRGGVRYVNDTTATMPDAVIAALDAAGPGTRLRLIVGGMDKAFDYRPLARALLRVRPARTVFLPGTGTDKVRAALARLPQRKKLAVYEAASMAEAVRLAREGVRTGDTVLLSPAGASFNLFKNEFDRGDAFVRAVRAA